MMFPPVRRYFFAGLFLSVLMYPALPASAQPTAERTLPSDPYVPGAAVPVGIRVTGVSGSVTVTETPPAGWTISQVLAGGQVNGGVITWSLTGSRQLGYTVTAPESATGDAVFTGTVGDQAIGGMDLLPQGRLPFAFGTPVNLGSAVNSSHHECGASVSGNGLEIYFYSDRPGGLGDLDIWVATRATLNDDWSAPVNLGPGVNSETPEWDPEVTADGLALYFASGRAGGIGGMDLWVARRPTPGAPWGAPENLGPTINSQFEDASPSLTSDGLYLVFAREGEIYASKRSGIVGDWLPAEKLEPPINSPSATYNVSVSGDGLTLVFESNRPNGFGAEDLYAATRESLNAPWSVPVNLGSTVNSRFVEIGPSISQDGRTLYFCDADRPGGFGGGDIWQVSVERVTPSSTTNWDLYR